jgi:hypothetical protein
VPDIDPIGCTMKAVAQFLGLHYATRFAVLTRFTDG